MGSATKQALTALSSELDSWGGDLAAAREVLATVGVFEKEASLRGALADSEHDNDRKRQLIERVLAASAGERARALLAAAASHRWSNDQDFLLGVQELGVRAVAQSSGKAQEISTELLAIAEAISEDGELELTLGSKLTAPAAKREIAERLFGGKVGEATLAVLLGLIEHPMGRRVRRLLSWGADIASAQAQRSVATVTSAAPLPAEQLTRLEAVLSRKYGRQVQLATLIDPSVLGGIRVEFGDDVIDDTVASRLNDLRRALA